ncbi:MAG TPA: hypothetical protein VM715_04670 [Candidatus Acidoferrum sp.]|jgi:hypothetical protein|nr:hypothetical protein [Candidatus Acidoferrum sp.]
MADESAKKAQQTQQTQQEEKPAARTRNLVAVSTLRHGTGDPENPLVEVGPGETVPGDTFSKEDLQRMYEDGTVTVEGYADDPNTWLVAEPGALNPSMAEAVITDVARALEGPQPGEAARSFDAEHTQDQSVAVQPGRDTGSKAGAVTSKTSLVGEGTEAGGGDVRADLTQTEVRRIKG